MQGGDFGGGVQEDDFSMYDNDAGVKKEEGGEDGDDSKYSRDDRGGNVGMMFS